MTKSLAELNASGLIPGPDENENAFSERVDYCLDVRRHLSDELKTLLGKSSEAESKILHNASAEIASQYDCSPDWIPVFFTNHRLPFWQGGCAWIFQMTEKSPTASLIQLRKQFEKQKKYLGLYDRDELLRHELCHAGRMMFNEPRYEEMIAYRTSGSAFRRFFGPLAQSSTETALFLLLLFVIIVFDVFLLATGRTGAYTASLWLKGIPLLLIFVAVWRLWRRQKTFDRCMKNVSACIGPNRAGPVVFRLTDHEIEAFARMDPNAIKAYALEHGQEELRWKVIHDCYFR